MVPSGFRRLWFCVSSTSFHKSNIGRPHQPPTEKLLKFNFIFHDSVKQNFVSKHQNNVILVLRLLNSRTWMTLKSSVVMFQALKTLQPHWPQQPQQPQWPQWPRQPHFIKKYTDPDGWIISGTSSKIQIFTNVWYPFYLLRPANATFLKTGWWNTNGKTSWTHHLPWFKKIFDPSSPQSHLL